MEKQLDLFATPTERLFLRDLRERPEVYVKLVDLAREVQAAGFKQYSVYALFNRLRWHFHIEKRDFEFKLNNNVQPLYARKLMKDHPELDGFFQLRESRWD